MLSRNKLKPELVYYSLNGAGTLARSVIYTVMTIYLVTKVHLDPLQLVLVGTVLEAVYFLSEVPTGVVADTYSRRLSVIIGTFMFGAAYLVQGLLPVFAFILLGEAVRSVGEAFVSGATEAWLADEVGEEAVGPILIRSGQINRGVGIAGTILSVVMAGWSLELPILLGGAIFLGLGVFLLLFMGEAGFKPVPQAERSHWQSMTGTFRQGVQVLRASHILIALVFVSAVTGISSEGFDRLWEAHLLTNFTFPALGGWLKPVAWFGIIGVAENLVSLAVTEFNRRRLEGVSRDPIRTARWLMVFSALTIAAGIGFAWAGNFAVVLGILLLRGVFFSIQAPIYDTWLIQHVRPEVRATVISMLGQANAIGQVSGGPGVGAVGKFGSLRLALVLSALLFTPAPVMYGWVLRKETASQAQIHLAEQSAD
jgi:DHA3 family tetracycline resistance protein-like MFS transporter